MSKAGEVYLSVVVPAYNEESVIGQTLVSITDFLSRQTYTWEVIVVDDASTDGTAEKTRQFMSRQPDNQVRLLVNEQNRQKGAAIRKGVLTANGKYTAFLDADYAYPIEQISNFLNHLENGAHIVIGNRTDPDTIFWVKPIALHYIYRRYLFGRVFNWLVRLLLVKRIRDTQCGMKAFQTDTAKAVLEKMRIVNFAFDVEFLYIAWKNGENIVQIPVTYDYIDAPSTVQLFKHSVIMFKSLIQIKLNGWMGRYVSENKSKNSPKTGRKE